jgi:hypothetical protein
MPYFQVMIFHAVAVIRATKRTVTSWPVDERVTRPVTVKATALPPPRAPKNDIVETRIIPIFGVADREAIKVAAIELAS